MKYRKFKNTGLIVSEIGIGTNRFGHNVEQKEVNKIIGLCLDEGINFIDTANVYAQGLSEEYLGKSFNNNRKDFIIATKVGWPNEYDKMQGRLSAVNIHFHVENSLRKLKTDYIDILYLHKWDEITPIYETLQQMKLLINQGKIRYIAVSNFNSWQTALTYTLARREFNMNVIANQSEYNLIKRNVYNELNELVNYIDIAFIPYFPLASGFLTGKYKKNTIPKNSRGEWADYMKKYFKGQFYEFIEKLKKISDEKNSSLSELSISWLLYQKNISSVICGVRSAEQLNLNKKAVDVNLNKNDLKNIDKLYINYFNNED